MTPRDVFRQRRGDPVRSHAVFQAGLLELELQTIKLLERVCVLGEHWREKGRGASDKLIIGGESEKLTKTNYWRGERERVSENLSEGEGVAMPYF
jgi:hypothetical protein